MSEEPATVEELAERAEAYLHETSLTPEEYFTKTHVCQREYDALGPEDIDTGVDIENPYSGMQTAIFEMLEEHGRLYRWTTEDDLIECIETIP